MTDEGGPTVLLPLEEARVVPEPAPDGTLALSSDGGHEAWRAVRRRRLAESVLAEVLDLAWEEARGASLPVDPHRTPGDPALTRGDPA